MSDAPVVGGTPEELRLMVRHRLRLIRQSIEIRRNEATGANSYEFIHRGALRDIDILVEQLHDELEVALVPRPEPRHVFEPLHGNDHPHCKFCGVPQFSSEADWNNGICDKREGARPESREPESPLLTIALTADEVFIVRLALSYYANVGTQPARLNEHIAAARAIELRAAVRPASAPSRPQSLDYVRVLHDAKAIVNASVLYRKFIDGTPLENDIAVWMADFVFAQLKTE